MKGTIVDKNFAETYVCLEDGEIITLPTNAYSDSKIGDYISLSSISSHNNCYSNNCIMNEKLLDFY